jgi:hypothetical protein
VPAGWQPGSFSEWQCILVTQRIDELALHRSIVFSAHLSFLIFMFWSLLAVFCLFYFDILVESLSARSIGHHLMSSQNAVERTHKGKDISYFSHLKT